MDEGEYPPVEDNVSSRGGVFGKGAGYVWMFFRQCFQYKIFIYLFLASGLNSASNICRGMFNVLFATEDIGMSVATYGKIMGTGAFISALLIFFVGKLMDKTHPMLVFGGGGIFIMVINIFAYFFIYTPETFMVIGIATQIMYAFQALAGTPLQINIVPADKYGQFSSANSLVHAVVLMAGSWAGGLLTKIYGYRVMFIWDFVITGFAMFFLYLVYLEWKRYGGRNYVAPVVK
jgi:predicted MFS family arabinose efflux permease